MNIKPFVALLAGLSLAACSHSSAPATSSGASDGGASTTVKVGPCGGVTVAQAAAILHIAPADVDGPHHYDTFSCVYRSHKDFYTSLTFNVYVESSAALARHRLDALKDGLSRLSAIVAVDHLGDEAWRAPNSRVRRLLMRKGNVWLDVTTPGDQPAQVEVARIVLQHLH